MQRSFLLSLLALLGFAAGPASAQQPDPYSAKVLLPACLAWVEAESRDLPDIEGAFKQGICIAIFGTMLGYGPTLQPAVRFCPPSGATVKAATLLVISGAESQPDLLNEDLRNVIVSILRVLWPCTR